MRSEDLDEQVNEIESGSPPARGGSIRPEADVVSARTKMMMLSVYGFLIALRYPWLLLHGRLWIEDGTVYLRAGWADSLSTALFASHQAYYALWPNAVGLVAGRWIPLPLAALFMTWCAFLIQLLAGYCFLQCEAFAAARVKALALAVLLMTAPSYEVWLNTINSQTYLVLCSAVILISRSGRHWIQRNAVLVLATLTGPLTVILAPFFLLRAVLRKSRAAYLQAGLVSLLAAIQVAVVRYSLGSGVRQIVFDPAAAFPVYLVRFVALPLGSRWADLLGTTIVTHHPLPTFIWVLADLFVVGGLIWIVWDRVDRSSLWLVAMALWLSVFSIYGSYKGEGLIGERYVFPSAVLIGLSLVLVATRAGTFGRKKTLAKILLSCFLLSGGFDYLTYSVIYVPFVRPTDPEWYSQARAREKDPNQELTVWPNWYPLRRFYLPPKHP